MKNEESSLYEANGRKCKICYGYGMWAWGDQTPMGPIDARDGIPTTPCFECGASANPIDD